MPTKAARLSLYVKPGYHDKLKNLAFISGVSMNELINRAIHEYLEARQDDLENAEKLLAFREELTKEIKND